MKSSTDWFSRNQFSTSTFLGMFAFNASRKKGNWISHQRLHQIDVIFTPWYQPNESSNQVSVYVSRGQGNILWVTKNAELEKSENYPEVIRVLEQQSSLIRVYLDEDLLMVFLRLQLLTRQYFHWENHPMTLRIKLFDPSWIRLIRCRNLLKNKLLNLR